MGGWWLVAPGEETGGWAWALGMGLGDGSECV